MLEAQSLLIEIGTEELPPKALDTLALAFGEAICTGLSKRGIGADVGKAQVFCTPRRLAVRVPSVAARQPDQTSERRGPALAAAFDANGKPTKALLGFAASCGVDVQQLEKLQTEKGSWLVHRAHSPGQATAQLVPQIVLEALKALPIPKPMRWGAHEYSFVRPVHWIVLLHGDKVIDGEIFGIKVDRMSRGHRFHYPQPLWIGHATSYEDQLLQAKVIVDPLLRRQRIVEQIDRVAAELGGRVVYPDALLDEVNNLVEWPMAIACSFERAFLRVPAEALMTTMETNQRFFPVLDAAGSLTENFIGVANVESSNPAEIRKGYERVIRPRFADAQFFYDEDRKTPLERLRETLRQVTYQKDLGSLFEKCERVVVLARVIATNLGSDVGHAVRAAALCKCDLMTRMVGEFPELQGVMGRYYASSGEHPEAAEVAVALDEFYAPRFAGDRIATSRTGQVLAVAERLDTLAGIFAVGMKPSGNKDPFALRRAALGLARTLIEGQLELDLEALLREAVELIHPTAWGKSDAKALDALGDIGERRRKLTDEIYEFVIERLRGYYADQGIGADIFDAVRAVEPVTLTEFDQRLRAVLAFTQLPESSSLAAANKRIGNILKQSAFAGTTRVDGALLQAGAEQALHAAVQAAATEIDPLVDKRNFIDAFKRLAALREPVDAYFDGVMVLVEDPALRHNRLALLAGLRRMFLRIADISLLPSGE